MEKYLDEIIRLSLVAYNLSEIPVGAIVVKNGKIIGRGYNNRESSKSVLGHAEINAIVDACKNINDWRLNDCDLYVTLEPCLMCIGTILESRIGHVYYLCNKTNKCFSFADTTKFVRIDDELRCKEYLNLLQEFFKNRRK